MLEAPLIATCPLHLQGVTMANSKLRGAVVKATRHVATRRILNGLSASWRDSVPSRLRVLLLPILSLSLPWQRDALRDALLSVVNRPCVCSAQIFMSSLEPTYTSCRTQGFCDVSLRR